LRKIRKRNETQLPLAYSYKIKKAGDDPASCVVVVLLNIEL